MYPGSVKMLQNLMGINKFNNYLIPYAAWSNLTFEKNILKLLCLLHISAEALNDGRSSLVAKV